MNDSEFLRIERDVAGGSRHYVVHMHDPKFSVELTPDRDAPDQLGRGVIKRLCVPNSWAGDYSCCAKFINAAQDFFARSGIQPASRVGPRRLAG